MKLTTSEKKMLRDFIDPLRGAYALPFDTADRIEADRLTVGYLNAIQSAIDTVLFTAGKPASVFRSDEKQYRHLQELAGMAHYVLRNYRAYVWNAPRKG
ncbi:MAG: hypothetical protein IJ461_01795 [Clostridia bacterium]|nr:hypothetical protein [Clostridia bacterium]